MLLIWIDIYILQPKEQPPLTLTTKIIGIDVNNENEDLDILLESGQVFQIKKSSFSLAESEEDIDYPLPVEIVYIGMDVISIEVIQ